ncbi:MAG: MTH895/ArsE family thioredoxin-like protein [Planctomycetota bacterium]|jgi:small redox-active disulfide protein 2
MKIQILGTGCPKCNQLYHNAQQAVIESGIEAAVEKVTDLNDIMAFGWRSTDRLKPAAKYRPPKRSKK